MLAIVLYSSYEIRACLLVGVAEGGAVISSPSTVGTMGEIW